MKLIVNPRSGLIHSPSCKKVSKNDSKSLHEFNSIIKLISWYDSEGYLLPLNQCNLCLEDNIEIMEKLSKNKKNQDREKQKVERERQSREREKEKEREEREERERKRAIEKEEKRKQEWEEKETKSNIKGLLLGLALIGIAIPILMKGPFALGFISGVVGVIIFFISMMSLPKNLSDKHIYLTIFISIMLVVTMIGTATGWTNPFSSSSSNSSNGRVGVCNHCNGTGKNLRRFDVTKDYLWNAPVCLVCNGTGK